MNKIKVLVADDHEIVRLGLISLLEQYSDLEAVGGGAICSAEVLSKTEQYCPDVIIMDVRLKGSSGIDACREVCSRFPQVKVIMLTSYGDEEIIMESIFAGAKGFILKDVGNDELIRAVQAVYRGESLLDPVITNKLLARMRNNRQSSDDAFEHLTDQEKKVLICIVEGKTNREIAEKIFLSEKTVRNYVSSILGKLHLSNRTEAAAFASKKNLFIDA